MSCRHRATHFETDGHSEWEVCEECGAERRIFDLLTGAWLEFPWELP